MSTKRARSNERPGIGFVLIVTLMLSFFFIPQSAHGQPSDAIHSISVTLEPEEGHIRSYATEVGTYTFTGTVEVQKPQSVERVRVTLEGWASNNWSVEVRPNEMYFDEPGIQSYEANVLVPPSTPASLPDDITHVTVQVHGSSPLWNGDASAIADIVVDQYFALSLSSPRQVIKGRPGIEMLGTLVIHNDGNGPDTVRVELIEGVDLFLREDYHEVVSMLAFKGTSVGFSFTVRDDVDIDITGEAVPITFRVTSLTAESHGILCQKTYTMTVLFDPLSERASEVPWQIYAFWTAIIMILVVVLAAFARIRRRRRTEELLRRFTVEREQGDG